MAQSIKNRVFGSDIPIKIKKKIEARQLLAYKAPTEPNQQIKPSEYPDDRSSHYTFAELNEMNFGGVAELSSRTPFVRMWTSVNLSKDILIKEMDKKEKEEWESEKYKEVDGKLPNIEKEEYKDKYIKNINDKYELHQWEKLPNSTKVYQIGNHVLNTLEVEPNSPRVTGDVEGLSPGITKGVLPYEQETDSNKWLKPPAGITGLSSETEGAIGTIKKTTVNFVVHNFSDFETIYLRYFLKPGAQIFVDFGWDTAHLYDIESLLEDDSKIENKLFGGTGAVSTSAGDLETLIGHVTDYDATVREDGGFDCSVTIMSKNMSLLSKAFDPKLKERVKYGLDIEALGYAVSNVLGDPLIYAKSTKWGNDSKTEEELRQTLQIAAMKLLGGMKVKLPGSPNSPSSKLASEHGIFYAGSEQENMKLFINFGWFEDRFLNKEFGYSDDINSLLNSDGDSVSKDEGSLKSKFNSKNSFCVFNNALREAMRTRGFYESAHFLYPETWGSEGHTYNTKLGMVPDEYLDPNIYGNHKQIEGAAKGEIYDDEGNLLTAEMFGMTDEEFQSEFGDVIEEITTDASQIPLREIFISADMIKDSMDLAQSLSEFLNTIMSRIKDASGGLIDLGLKSNSYSQHTLSFVDKNNISMSDNTPKKPDDMPEFLQKLLVFKPYTRNTIVKEYTLAFNMPQGGLGNMIAIQSSGHLDSSLSINDVIDGFVQFESLARSPHNTDDNIFVRYNPSIGEEAGRRFEKITKQQSAGTFSFSKDDVAFNQSNQTKKMLGEIRNSEAGFTDVSGLENASIDDFKDLVDKNLNRAVDPSEDLDGNLIKPKTSTEDTIEDTKKSEQELARSSGNELVNTPYDYYIKNAVHSHSLTSNPPIPIEASLKIYGISSLVPGDLCRINYLPQNYLKSVYFQIMKVSHDIGTTWDTSLTLQMRMCSIEKDNEEAQFRVRKSYLRNVLKLKEIDSFIHLFDNLLPLEFEHKEAQYIDNKFLCQTAATLDEELELPALETSLNEDDTIESFKHFLGSENWWGKDSAGKDFKGLGDLIIHTKFNNYVSPFGNATGAIEASIKGFKHDPDPIQFHLYTSGKNWLIVPISDEFEEKWVDDIFMVSNDKVITSKLKEVKTAAKKTK